MIVAMELDAHTAWRALAARDARFDGRLFVGVTSTGVYCRPICRVRTPRRENCRFFPTAAQAEAAAFRPCMKCRPEIAPGAGLPWTVMDASRTLAQQAAQELDAVAADGRTPSLPQLAARLGVTDRHLRRIFLAEHGVTALQYLQTRRLLLSKQLLTDTVLPVAQVALHCGFRSLRRFNDAFVQRYRMSPSRLRGAADSDARPAGPAAPIELTLAYRSPYATAALLQFFAQRAIPGIETVEGTSVRRSLRAQVPGAQAGWIEARFEPDRARVRIAFAPALAVHSGRIVAIARRWLDLDSAPASIDAALGALATVPGLRLPGCTDAFELAVRAVLGQQVTVAAARTLARRLVQAFGAPVSTPWPDIDRAFPAPAVLAATPAQDIAALGIVGQRAAAIVALAQAWPQIDAGMQARIAPQELIDALCALPGIGVWTAQYITMRATGWSDAFLPGDVAVIKAMRQRLGPLPPREIAQRAQAWQPWRSYAVLHLWKSLESAA
jgi:AraC family transcriptional regulator of adaptative response / DNA-3-methyladenine glycosylase II